jgi:hypothetical protein
MGDTGYGAVSGRAMALGDVAGVLCVVLVCRKEEMGDYENLETIRKHSRKR